MSLVWERKLKNVEPLFEVYPNPVHCNPLKCFSLIPLLACYVLFVFLYVIFVFYGQLGIDELSNLLHDLN